MVKYTDNQTINGYMKHEEEYKKLKDNGFEGWGADNFHNRMEGWKINIEKIKEYLGNCQGNLLEIGCGTGDVSRLFYGLGFNVTGVDVAETAVDWAKEKSLKNGDNIRFIASDICSTFQWEKEKYDVVIDGNCIHCILGQDRVQLLNNINSSLKQGGIFFISSIVLSSDHDEKEENKEKLKTDIAPIERWMTTAEALEKELIDAGFILRESWINERKANSHYCGIFMK